MAVSWASYKGVCHHWRVGGSCINSFLYFVFGLKKIVDNIRYYYVIQTTTRVPLPPGPLTKYVPGGAPSP